VKASLIIPTYNRGEVLCKTLEMALKQAFDDYEVIVVDQTPAYAPAVQEYLDSLASRIRYYKLTYPNVSAARNLGIRMAKGEILIFIDDDVIISKDFIISHVRNFTDEKIGGVMGLILGSQDADLKDYLAIAKSRFLACAEVNLGDIVAVEWLPSTNVSYRCRALLEAGMFDEYLRTSCEDVDMSIRVRAIGYQLLLDTKIKLVHLALSYGGCEEWDPKFSEQKEYEGCLYNNYFLLKNWRIIGFWDTLEQLFNGYRSYAFSRSVIKKGLYRCLQRNLRYIKLIKRVIVDLKKRKRILYS